MEKNILAENPKTMSYSGKVSDYIRKAVYGVRCMSSFNKAWDVNFHISDFDNRSLYQSAMSVISIPPVILKIHEQDQINYNFLQKQDGYVVTIHITKMGKCAAFPPVLQQTKEGVDWNDYIPTNLTIVLDDIMLKDLIVFQKFEFEVLGVYYWNEGVEQKLFKDLYRKIY